MNRIAALLAVCLLLSGCDQDQDTASPTAENKPKTDKSSVTVNANKTFTSPKTNKTYTYEIGKVEPKQEVENLDSTPVLRPAIAATAENSEETFTGKIRRDAKLSIVSAQAEIFEDVTELAQTLKADDQMKNHHTPKITDSTPRVEEEQRNVAVNAYLYLVKKEADRDFHLIIGDKDKKVLMTAEVAGLPETINVTLRNARNEFKAHFGEHLPGAEPYIFHDGIPVRVTGSLFFDTHHDQVGSGDIKTTTSWEIHPVTHVVFEP